VVAVLATAGHTAVTTLAAPLNFSQRDHAGDLDTLTRIFDQFAQLNLLRAVLQSVVVAALAWILLTRQAHPQQSVTPVITSTAGDASAISNTTRSPVSDRRGSPPAARLARRDLSVCADSVVL
jgi:hypothetical protein